MQLFDSAVRPEGSSAFRKFGALRLRNVNRAEGTIGQPCVDKVIFEFHFARWFVSAVGASRLSVPGEWTRYVQLFGPFD